MRSIFVSSAIVVVGTLLALVQALGSEKVLTPVQLSRPISAAHSSQEKTTLKSGARHANPSIDKNSNKWDSPPLDSESLAVNNPLNRRSYEAPLFLGKRGGQHYSAFNQRFRRSVKFGDDVEADVDGSAEASEEKRGYDVPQFLGKRFGIPQFVGKRKYDVPQFLGKRGYSVPNFVGRRAFGPPQFVGKRGFSVPQFVGKRGYSVPSFVGKRGYDVPAFVGKRGFEAPAFVGKRGYDIPAFVGKRDYDVPQFVGKRGIAQPMFVGKRGFDVPSFVGKRGLDVPAFIGKRKEESFRDLLATLQAYREYRRLMQTDKRFEAPLFVGKRSGSTSSAEGNELQR